MNPIKFCLNITAAIILAPLVPIVALAWLAVWLNPEQQSASVANPQVRGDTGLEIAQESQGKTLFPIKRGRYRGLLATRGRTSYCGYGRPLVSLSVRP